MGDYLDKYIQALEKRGAYAVRVSSDARRGQADLIACFKGHFVAFGVKENGRISNQSETKEMDRVDQARGVAAVVQTPQEMFYILDDLQGKRRPPKTATRRPVKNKGVKSPGKGAKLSVKPTAAKQGIKGSQGSLWVSDTKDPSSYGG